MASGIDVQNRLALTADNPVTLDFAMLSQMLIGVALGALHENRAHWRMLKL